MIDSLKFSKCIGFVAIIVQTSQGPRYQILYVLAITNINAWLSLSLYMKPIYFPKKLQYFI